LIESNQRSSQPGCFFAAQGLCPANQAELGPEDFAPLLHPQSTLQQNPKCPPTHNPTTFCLILPEAYWLTEAKKRECNYTDYVNSSTYFYFRSAEQLRMKSNKTMVVMSDGRGIAIIAEA